MLFRSVTRCLWGAYRNGPAPTTRDVPFSHQYDARRPTSVKRYLLPNLCGLNLVLENVLDGGVNDSLNLDMHGKALSFHLLLQAVEVPAGFVPPYGSATAR